MSTLDEAKMPSLKDKILAQAEQAAQEKAKEDVKGSQGKGRRIKSKTKN